MSRTDTLDLESLRLAAGQGRRLQLETGLREMEFGGERYATGPLPLPVTLDVSRMTNGGYSLRLRFEGAIEGPCMRCLRNASPTVAVDAREVDQPGGGEELTSPYLEDGLLDVAGWANDALALALPAQVLCRDDCAGLCPECGVDLDEAGPDHHHDAPPDPRWAKLRELELD